MPERSTQPIQRHRLEVRVTAEQDALIREAADLEHMSITAFVLGAVIARARKTLDDRQTITLANEAFDQFYASLEGAERAVPELVELFRTTPSARG